MASGRGVICKKDLADETRSIDMMTLNKHDALLKGPFNQWTAKWSRLGEVVATVGYSIEVIDNEPCAILFNYSITDRQNQKTDYNYSVQLTSTPCHLGGKRYWFICPLTLNGRHCGRRCRIIYLPSYGRFFGCRECYQLTYECRQLHRNSGYEIFRLLGDRF